MMKQYPSPSWGRQPGTQWAMAGFLAGVLCFVLTAAANAQLAPRVEQASNGTPEAPISSIDWVTTTVTPQKGHYVEGSSIPYRLVFDTILPGPHRVVIAWDTKTSGRHAVDYLTHFNRLQPHNQFGSHTVPENIQPLRNLSGGVSGPLTFAIPPPSPAPGSFQALPSAQRAFQIFNGTITSAAYVAEGTLEKAAAESRMEIQFTVSDSPTVILFGGHLAAKEERGPGQTAAGVTGIDYRMRVVEMDGIPVIAGVSVNSTAVVAAPTCSISGPDSMCPVITNIFTAGTDATTAAFAWTITANNAGALIVGGGGGPGVQVRAERGGSFILQLAITDGPLQTVCARPVSVLTNVGATPLASVSACPGGTVTFTTTPSGTGPFTFVWRRGDTALPQTSSHLMLTNVALSDAGIYCVEVRGPCNTVTNCATLTVNSPARASDLVNLSRCVSEGAVFSTIASGTGPFTYRWRKNGAELSGQTNRLLSIPNLVLADAGTYTVEVSGACNSVTNTANLLVYALPVCGIQGPGTICPQSAASAFSAPPGMAEYHWRVLGNGGIVGPTNQQSVIVAAGSPGFLTVGLTTINSNGCSRSCSRTITVGDIQPPIITCPENIQTNTEPGKCSQVVGFAVTASDNCDGVTLTCNPPSGTRFSAGTTPVTCTALDGSGNQAGCSFNVTVMDLEKPTLSWPTNLVVNTQPGLCEAPVAYNVTVSDNCSGASLLCSPPSGTIFPLGTSSVTCRGSDAAGNVEFCTFQVTVVDNEGPQISCPPDLAFLTDPGACDVLVEYNVDATDNCAMARVICTPPSGSLFSVGITTVTCVASDVNKNQNRCSFSVEVDDSENPQIVCPGNMNVFCEPGRCDAIVSFSVTATDNCGGVNLACAPPSGARFSVGQTNVNCTASDGSGNTVSCAFSVNVYDNERPSVTCPTNLVVNAAIGRCDAIVQYAPLVTDNCPGAHIECAPPSGTVFPVGISTVNCLAADTSTNVVTCTFTVSVLDAEPPAIVCPGPIATNALHGQCTAFVEFNLSPTDNCPGVELYCDWPGGSAFPLGETWVYCVAFDTSGNLQDCAFPVTVRDTEPPSISCPADIVLNTATGRCDAVATFAPTATDNCGQATVTCVPPSGTIFAKGTNLVNCTGRDAVGNTAACAFRVIVQDRERPGIVCPANIVTNSIAGQCHAVVAFAAAATDNCPGTTVVCLPPSGSAFATGQTAVTCTATDASGNTNRCAFFVNVNDVERPEIMCPTDIVRTTEPGRCDAVVNFAASAVDNCPGASVICLPPSGGRFSRGATVVACTATDASGNVAACAFTVTVNDTQPPTITCPAQIVTNASLGRCDAVVTYAANTTDNCLGATIVCTPPSGAAFITGVTAVNCLAADASGNTNQCSFTVTVQDREKPVIACPQPQELFTQPGHCDAVATFAAVASDNCSGVTNVCVPPSGSRFSKGVNTVTCTATDTSGNTDTCAFTITVRDVEPPVLNCPTNIVLPTELGRCDAIASFAAAVTDDCAGASVICAPQSGTRFSRGITPVICTAVDASSNRVTCSFTVTVQDRENPRVICPVNVLTNTAPGRCDRIIDFTASATDNCAAEVICEPASGSTFTIGTNIVICTATDSAGNRDTCAFSVAVMDSERPVITCPSDVVVNTEFGRCDALVMFAASATDNCTLATLSCVPPSGSRFSKGLNTVTCSATDAATNTATCSFRVIVNDRELPTIICPQNLVLNTDPGGCSARATFSPSVSDNCPGVTGQCTPSSGYDFPIGITTVVCSAMDASGNTRSCAFDVRVFDAEPPRLNCPGDLTVNTEPSECTATVEYAVTGVDGCSLTNLACFPPTGALFNKGVTLVHCSAKDASGNEATCAFNVTVRDNESPAILCPTNMIVSALGGRCDASVDYDVSVSDNCDPVTVLCVPPSGTTFSLGTTPVSCSVTDASGNTNQCAFTVRVVDSQKPTVTCPANMVVNCDSNRCDALVTFAVSAADNCGPSTSSCNPASGSRFNLGVTPVTCSSTDASGNVGTCSFTVTVRDNQAPVLQCPASIFANAAIGRCDAPVFFNVTAADNCGSVGASCVPPSGSYFPVGSSVVNCSASDSFSNVGTCQFAVTVRDIESPALQCPADMLVNTATGRCDAIVNFAPQVSDNCSSVNVTCAPPSGTAFPKGTNFVTCTARDLNSNSINCTFRIVVRDAEKPQIICPGDMVTNAEPAECRARVAFLPTATDNCNGVTIVCNPPSNSYFNKGVTTVICVATDTSGNTNRCSFSVTVNDAMPPNITCPANIITNASRGQRSAVVQFAPTVSDNCSGMSYICTPQSGSVFQEGVTPVNCTATDSSGNSRSCSFMVSVNDTEPPVINCPTNLTFAATTGRCDAVCVYDVTATDNSQSAAVSCAPPSGSTLPKGLTDVLCTATDPASNRVTCAFKVNVVDLELPAIACPTNTVLYTDPGRCDTRVTYITNATDNCGVASLTCTPASGALLPKGTNTVTCTALDTSGNIQVCAFTVRVLDIERPSISCPGKLLFNTPPGQCSASVTYNVTATDNCPGTSVSCTPASGSQFPKGTTTVNCTARDASGNNANCSFQVEMRDLESPVITCPSDINTVSYPGSCGIPVTYAASVSDNCPGATLSCVPPSGSTMPVGTNVVFCNGVDASGNSAACSFRIFVRDVEPPVISCPRDIVIDGSSNGQCTPVATFNPAVTDNCPGAVVSCTPPSGTSFPQGTTRVQCIARDAAANMSGCSFSVTVRLDPLTATPLQSQTRCAGETATFATSATGSGTLIYRWFKDGLILSGRTNTSLLLSNLTTADAGVYAVLVQSPCGSVSNVATLNVRSPVVISGMTNATRCDCDPLVLSPTVSGTGPFSYLWRKNGALIAGANSNTLAFSKLTTNDAAIYTVEVSGACNTASASAAVTVIHVPNPAVYTNSGVITIFDNAPAFPYPSSVHVTCVPETVKRATVTLRGFSHAYPDDVDMLLTAPDGRCVLLMSDVGAGSLANNINITLDDSAAVPLPDSSQLFSGTFRPANYDTDSDNFAVPAPKTPPAVGLSTLGGADPNGFWSLFVMDDFQLDSGVINNGWVLRLYWEEDAVRISAPRVLPDGSFQIILVGQAQTTCTIQASSDLRTWSPIATVTLTGPQTPFTDPNPSSPRFYRAVRP